jgi:hypothetical protein
MTSDTPTLDAHRHPVDVERLYRAIVDELVVLWGEPSDAISTQGASHRGAQYREAVRREPVR